MFRIALKNVMARKGRLLLTSLAVIAGCTFLSGVFVFSDTISGSFNRLFANAYQNTDAYVRSSNVIEGDFGDESRPSISSSMIDTARAVPGVAEAQGVVQGFARIATSAGKALGVDGPPKNGGAFEEGKISPWKVVEGRAATADTEVVIDKRSAKEGKIKVGDSVTVTTAVGAQPFTVSGIAKFAGSDSSGGASWALFTLQVAERFVLGKPGEVDAIAIRGDGSVDDKTLAARVNEAVKGQTVEVLTGTEITQESQSAIAKGFSFFSTFLTIFAAIALLVGSFVIYNVFRITAAQRQRENALMRAIGARRGQVVKALFVEATAVGLVGGILGFGAGLLLATFIIWLLSALGFGISDTTLVVSQGSFFQTVIVGLLVTLVCATFPAIRAGKVPPLAALRDVSIDRSGLSKVRILIGSLFALIAAGGIALGFNSAAIWLGPGVAALFASLIALGPVIVGPVTSVLYRPLKAVRGVTGEIAIRNAARSPERTALTAAALGIGLALLVGVSTLGSSLRGSIEESFGKIFTGGFAVTSPDSDGNGGGMPTKIADELNKLPEVGDAVGIGFTQIRVVENGKPSKKGVLTLDPQRAANVLDVTFVQGGWTGLTDSSILVSKDKADRDKLALGSKLDVSFLDDSRATLTVGGIFDSKVLGNLIVTRTLIADRGKFSLDAQIVVNATPGTSVGAASVAIKTVTDKYPTVKFESRDQFIASQSADIQGPLNFIYALLGMSVFIAVLGIVLTLLLAVYERRRELGLSRAIGMTQSQVRASIRWEAIVTAMLGAAMGTGLGVALGWIIVRALRDEGLSVFRISPISIVIFAVLAILFAVVAAWIPARRGARADILSAIATT